VLKRYLIAEWKIINIRQTIKIFLNAKQPLDFEMMVKCATGNVAARVVYAGIK
jgi:hypothetical protein